MISFAHRHQMDKSIEKMRKSILDAMEITMNDMDSMKISDILAYEVIGIALERIVSEHRRCVAGMKTCVIRK